MGVYRYRPAGGTGFYTTPQEAFDACQEENENSAGSPEDFTEVNYVRGYEGVYESDSAEPVIRLAHSTSGRGVQPTSAYPLIFDRYSHLKKQ